MTKHLKVLRANDYVLQQCCTFCESASYPNPAFKEATVHCSALLEQVSAFGTCKRFKLDRGLLKMNVRRRELALLERRRFTRNNRHKALTRY